MSKETVLLTGGSGSMGFNAFQLLWEKREEYDIVLLVRPSQKNIDMFEPWLDGQEVDGSSTGVYADGSLKIIWGDATNPDDCLKAVEGVDVVLNPMALIAPAADHNPEGAKAVNDGAVKNLIDAVHKVGGADHIRFVHIGSVAQYGDRLAPAHMIRTGDPMAPSVFDYYATTKVSGEKHVIDSGLKYWVSLRQTFIANPDYALAQMEPIQFHSPLNTAIELNTGKDAGRGLMNALKVPKESEFWRRIYNMAGGPSCRFVMQDYQRDLFQATGMGDYRKVLRRRWHALRNFHCGWFLDSYKCNEYLNFWTESYNDHVQQAAGCVAAFKQQMIDAGTPLPDVTEEMMYQQMEQLNLMNDGTTFWYDKDLTNRLTAFYGSREAYEAIPDDWETDLPMIPTDDNALTISHGYDEDKAVLDTQDLRDAAAFRGGELVTPEYSGDWSEKLTWKDADGREFQGSATLVLRGGHWSPFESAPSWDFDKVAKKNPFFAQVWHASRGKDEDNYYDENCHLDILEYAEK